MTRISLMKRRSLLLLPLLMAGCASPDPLYFTLAARPGTASIGGPRLVELRRIGLAGYLDRSEIVRTNSDYRLRIADGERWGEPLGGLVARVLAEDLTTRLPGSSVFTSAGSISASPDATLELDIQRLDADQSGQVVLLVQVVVTHSGVHAASAQTIRLVVAPTGPATVDYVAAISTALGQLADRIVPLLLATAPTPLNRARR